MPANERVENPMLAEAAVGDGSEEEGAAAQSEEAAAQTEPRAKWERMVDALVAVYYVVAAGITGFFIAGLLYGGVFILTHFTEKDRQERGEFWRGGFPRECTVAPLASASSPEPQRRPLHSSNVQAVHGAGDPGAGCVDGSRREAGAGL